MTAAEFSAILARLGWSGDRAAAELGVSPHVVLAWTAGRMKVPARISAELRWESAYVERRALLDTSGLPECETLKALARAAEGKTGEAAVEAQRAGNEHVAQCTTCQARIAYVDLHGPPIPELPLPAWIRFFRHMDSAIGRLPASIRPPEPPRGEGRRLALMGVALGLVIELLLVPLAVSTGNALPASFPEGLKALAVVSAGYLIGFLLAGTVYDLLYPIRSSLAGTMLRWGLCTAIGYATITFFNFTVDSTPMPSSERAERALFFGVLASLYGAYQWSKRRRSREARASAIGQ